MSGENSADAVTWTEPPIDSDELCARLRFSLDEPMKLSQEDQDSSAKSVKVLSQRIYGEGVRVTRSLMPKVFDVAQLVAERLLLQKTPELFVMANCQLNAGVLLRDDCPLVVLNSALVELLTPEELASVVGHEFGHAILRHHRHRITSEAEFVFGLDRFRAQEVSADRIGLISAGSLEIALRAEFKIASGLQDRNFTFDTDALIKDAESTLSIDGDRDWAGLSTHPEFPFRVWALAKFAESDAMSTLGNWSGRKPIGDVELEIEDRFHAIGGGISFRSTSDVVHEAVAWIGVLIVCEDGEVTETERDVLVQLIGKIWADDATVYARRHGLVAVNRRAVEMLENLAHASSKTQRRIESAIQEFEKRTGASNRCREMLELARETMRPK